MINLKLKTNTINTSTFIGFILYMCYVIWKNSDPVLLIATAVLIILGVEKPTTSKFIKDVGLVMVDWKSSPQQALARLQNIWLNFAAVWVRVSEEVAKDEIEKIDTPPPE